jgi:flagellar protein FlaJ
MVARKDPSEESEMLKKEKATVAKGAEPFISWIASYFPWLKKTMREAGMTETINEFVWRALLTGAFLATLIVIAVAIIFHYQSINMLLLIPVVIIAYPLMVLYTMNYPRALVGKRRRDIDKDLVFAGRHLTISLRGGTPLFDAMLAIAKGRYGEVSKEMNKLVERVLVGVSIDEAAQEVMEDCPSPMLKRVLMQIVNAVRSGADVAESIDIVLNQISREQLIAVKEYGQRLNPLVMFYLIIGVIFPSLGVSVGLLLLSFVEVRVTSAEMWLVVPFVALLQFIFLSYAEMTRPVYEM